MATAKIENQVGAVYGAIGSILGELSVEKGGVLPGNMGSRPYITAVDLNAEVKRRFVEHNLILLPDEKFVKHEVSTSAQGRHSIFLVIEGHYTITSTLDGSSVTIAGVGDGLATGTAVAANIASTNALKNALLRTFMVTEQSVEDEAKNGSQQAEKPAKPGAEPLTADVGALSAVQARVRTLSTEVATATGATGRSPGKDLLESLSAEKWPSKSFATDVWKSVGALEELEIALNKMRDSK